MFFRMNQMMTDNAGKYQRGSFVARYRFHEEIHFECTDENGKSFGNE